MCCKIGDYIADECWPLRFLDELDDRSGVYVILGQPVDFGTRIVTPEKMVSYNNEQWQVIDVGQSKELSDRIESHNRRECWWHERNKICVAAIYVDASARRDIETKLRNHYNPPCGQR